MRTGDKREKRLNTVRHLFSKTVENGCTQEEANLAFETAQRMMRDWQIEESEVTAGEVKEEEEILSTQAETVVQNYDYVWIIAKSIAANFRTKAYRSLLATTRKKMNRVWNSKTGRMEAKEVEITSTEYSRDYRYSFFGEETDSKLSAFLFDQAINAAMDLSKKYVKSTERGFDFDSDEFFSLAKKASPKKRQLAYLEGFAHGLNKVLEDQVTNDGSGSTSLAVIRNMPERVVVKIYTLGLKKGKAGASGFSNKDARAYYSGKESGHAFGGRTKQTSGGHGVQKRLGA